MVERYLCLMLSGKIHGIDLSKLVSNNEDEVEVVEDLYSSEEEEYWEVCRPPPPPLPPPSSFDFTIDLSAWDMHMFSMDSKIFLIGGTDDDNQPCYQIYEFQCHLAAGNDDDDGNKTTELNPCESISKVPAFIDFYNSHITCISGEAYFLTFNDEEWCFWVLRGCGGEWERLPLNTLLETQDSLSVYYPYQIQKSQWFYSDKKLFLPSSVQYNKSQHVLCCFDLQTRQWTMEELDRFTSFRLCLYDEDELRPFLPRLLVSNVIGLEDFTNYSVMLSYSLSELKRGEHFSENYPSRILAITKIYAMLVNQNGILVYQRINSCFLFKGIKPYFTSVKEIFFVDLGENKTCAMLFGFAIQDGTKKIKNIVLCVSIFTLTLKDEFDITTANHVDSWVEEERFLSVSVLSSHVYTIEENLEAMDYDVDIQQVFVCPPP